MSPTFQQITFADCCQTAEKVRAKYWKSSLLPVDIDYIIEIGLGISLIPLDGLRNDLDIYGFLSNDRQTIYLDSAMMITPKFEAALRFTMAHELGHFFLHQEFYEANKIHSGKQWKELLGKIDGANLTAYEDQADEFAGRLLIPLEYLKSELKSLAPSLHPIVETLKNSKNEKEVSQILTPVVADRLAPKFNVSFEVMLLRITREKIDPLFP